MESGPVNPRLPVLWHGGDYNPDQWPRGIREDDARLMKLAGVNVASTGIFAWSQIEPAQAEYDWSWLDETFDRFEANDLYIALATPSAAHPRWLTRAHPEVVMVDRNGRRLPHGGRQRFCPTSPVYREHVARINRALAERYGKRKALVLWHVSNEYGGTQCHCDLCAGAFRDWLKARYGSLDVLNHEWWATFWSHRFGDWAEVIPPYATCGTLPNGLRLDWRRFVSSRVCDFFKKEVEVLREVTPDVPVTTNLMGFYGGLDYAKFADCMDVVSWDCYAAVGGDPAVPAFTHAYMRGLKDGRPWLLMEQTPSATNWQEFPRLKPPGVMRLWSFQAIAHGSDSSMYFQWRATRGSHEKFHGAVVAHGGDRRSGEEPRVFKEVVALGADMAKVSGRVVGTTAVRARVGVLWDQENRWALEGSCGPGGDKRLVETARKHYAAFWRANIPVDVVRLEADWSRYGILVAPQLYMLKSGTYPIEAPPEETAGKLDVAAKVASWVEAGGTFVTTYRSGIVNESDLVYEGGYPGPLRKLLGVWVEEIDVPEPGRFANTMVTEAGAFEGARESFACDRVFDMIELEGAKALARYGSNWYAGRPCLTANDFGKGRAYYLGTDAEDAFLCDLYRALASEKGIDPLVPPVEGAEGAGPVEGVEVLVREGAGRRLLFLLNHNDAEVEVDLGSLTGTDLLTGDELSGKATLGAYGVRIVEVA